MSLRHGFGISKDLWHLGVLSLLPVCSSRCELPAVAPPPAAYYLDSIIVDYNPLEL